MVWSLQKMVPVTLPSDKSNKLCAVHVGSVDLPSSGFPILFVTQSLPSDFLGIKTYLSQYVFLIKGSMQAMAGKEIVLVSQ